MVGALLSGGARPAAAPSPGGKVGAYLPMVLVPWLLTFYVAWVGRDRSTHRSLGSLLGEKWSTAGRAAVDLALALVVALVIVGCERVLSQAVDAAQSAALVAILPRSLGERLAWVLVALSVGFGEEVVYRGYLQTQLGALTRRRWLGVVLQALLFGVAHLDQGPASAVIALYGLLLGGLVRFRGTVLPAIAAHIAIDAASAFL